MATADSFDDPRTDPPTNTPADFLGPAPDPVASRDPARSKPEPSGPESAGVLHVSSLRFTHASAQDKAKGLLGYIRFTLNRLLILDGFTLHRSGGGHAISYPRRKLRGDHEHHTVYPINDSARRQVDRLVLDALHRKGLLR